MLVSARADSSICGVKQKVSNNKAATTSMRMRRSARKSPKIAKDASLKNSPTGYRIFLNVSGED